MAVSTTTKAQLFCVVYILILLVIIVNSLIAIVAPETIDTSASPYINTVFGAALTILILFGIFVLEQKLVLTWSQKSYALVGLIIYFFLNILNYFSFIDNPVAKLYIGKGLYILQLLGLFIALAPSSINIEVEDIWYVNKRVEIKKGLAIPPPSPPPAPAPGPFLKPIK